MALDSFLDAHCRDSEHCRVDSSLFVTVTKVTQISAKDSETKDTLLVVHTLLLTFALATLQYSDQFVPVSGGEFCFVFV